MIKIQNWIWQNGNSERVEKFSLPGNEQKNINSACTLSSQEHFRGLRINPKSKYLIGLKKLAFKQIGLFLVGSKEVGRNKVGRNFSDSPKIKIENKGFENFG